MVGVPHRADQIVVENFDGIGKIDLVQVTLETGKSQSKMTTSGTIAAGRGMFTSSSETGADCINGNLKSENRTVIQANDRLRVPVRPNDTNESPETDSGTFLNLPLCYGSGNTGKETVWMAQVSLQ